MMTKLNFSKCRQLALRSVLATAIASVALVGCDGGESTGEWDETSSLEVSGAAVKDA